MTGRRSDARDAIDATMRPRDAPSRRRCRGASGSSPTASAATPPARSPACVTRRYHGLLVAALPAPLGRMVMLNHLLERVRLPDRRVAVARRRGRSRRPERRRPRPSTSSSSGSSSGCRSGATRSTASRSRSASLMPHRQNTVHVTYRLLAGDGPVRLDAAAVGPLPPHEAPVDASGAAPYTVARDRRPLRALGRAGSAAAAAAAARRARGASRSTRRASRSVPYRIEESRGYESVGLAVEPRLLPRRPRAGAARSRWSPRPSRGRRSTR